MSSATGPDMRKHEVIHLKFWDDQLAQASRFTNKGLISLDKFFTPNEDTMEGASAIIPPNTKADLAKAEPEIHPADSAWIEVKCALKWGDFLDDKIKLYERKSIASMSKSNTLIFHMSKLTDWF